MFDAVLDRVSRDRADAPQPGARSWTAIRGLNSSFVGPAVAPQAWRSGEGLDQAYFDHDSEPVAPPPKPVFDATHLKRQSAEEIARDLGLLPSDTAAQLQRKRRGFARLNHPDRTPEDWRDAATTRMKIANQLIDEALRKAASARP